MTINYNKCPNCGSKKTLKIIYGMPTHDTFLKAEEGKIKLGGCLVMDSNPEYYCSECNFEWNRATADRFLEELKSIDILNWKSKYVDLDILDGTQWSLEIQMQGKKISKHGSNMFPETWEAFCKIVKKTSGKKFG